MIKDENYITIQGWMCSKLHLKGNSLLVYAIIYGFCQDNESCFHGSLNYLCEFTNSTRQGIINTLTELVEKGLITKEQAFPNNRYRIVNSVTEEVNKVDKEVNLFNSESKENLQNNKDNNKEDNKDNIEEESKQESYSKSSLEKETIISIVKEMNEVWGTSFRSNSNLTVKFIKARLKEGYTREDFSLVIRDRYKKWGEHPTLFSNGQLSSVYLRPTTVFSPKMENYLMEARNDSNSTISVQSSERSEDRSDLVF